MSQQSGVLPRYPVYVPSKDRYQDNRAYTLRALHRDRIPCYVVVEPSEADAYRRRATPEVEVLVLPENDYGILRARNWICAHAENVLGAERHWQLDDNLIEFRRLYHGRRIPCHAGIALRVCEDLSDRYENVGISGLNYQMFVPAETPVPFYLNVHVYSCTLINHALPFRYRLACNEDVDICLRALSAGWCTIATNAFMANKLRTMVLGGGNTHRYLDKEMTSEAAPYRVEGAEAAGVALGEGTDTKERFDQTRLLERAWPGLVKTTRKFGRWQHHVDWGKFKQDPRLRLRPDVDLAALPAVDEYGLTLRAVKEVKSPFLRGLLDTA